MIGMFSVFSILSVFGRLRIVLVFVVMMVIGVSVSFCRLVEMLKLSLVL